MLGDFGIDRLTPMRLQPREGPFLVGADQPAVARNVRGENGSQPAFDAFPRQSGVLQPHVSIPALRGILTLRAAASTPFRMGCGCPELKSGGSHAPERQGCDHYRRRPR